MANSNLTANELMQATTTGNCVTYPLGNGGQTTLAYPYYYYTNIAPTECSGDVHVFPCPHCEKCKCGKATVKRDKKK